MDGTERGVEQNVPSVVEPRRTEKVGDVGDVDDDECQAE